ncbi:hypothetical protein HOH67_05565 [Candidatus Peregrinibacteria bacterium]|nr:hypothetical protein [Candidatus Peregrinibacteria bacterium]
MNKNMLFGLAVLASVVMFVVGADSSHLSELKDFFWVPLPLAAVLFWAGAKK